MIARERERTREPDDYDRNIAYTKAERERSLHGKVVVRGRDISWHQGRQALLKQYMYPSRYTGKPVETALDDWIVFVQLIKVHSGKHRHQGGLVIYVLEGEGYSIVEGERLDWEAGDLLLLPFKLGGVEHQHFNHYEDRPAKWIAFINAAIKPYSATDMVQVENHPDFRDEPKGRSRR